MDLRDNVAIERKMDLSELSHCYCQERKRFVREFERAKGRGLSYISWSRMGALTGLTAATTGRVHPKSLTASMLAWLARYNCQILFCKEENSGQVIHDVLYRELKERLEAMPDEEAI